MSDVQVTNPEGAFVGVDDFRTGVDENGFPLQLGNAETYTMRADAAVTRGQAVSIVAPTASVPLSVTPTTTSTDDQLFLGVAIESADEGDLVPVMRRGFFVVDVDGTVAAGNFLGVPGTSTGTFTAAATAAAYDVGVVLGPEDTTNNRCLAFLDPHGNVVVA